MLLPRQLVRQLVERVLPHRPSGGGSSRALSTGFERLVSPVLLASKCVIFNWKDTLQKDRILNLLAVITMAAAGINQEQSASGKGDGKVFASVGHGGL